MTGDRIGKPTDIDTQLERTHEMVVGVFFVTLNVHIEFSQSLKHIDGSHAGIYHNETMPIH